jgi:uncharacterized protein
VELLDEGNTVPFVARYRKDRTGGLDEELIREIQSRLTKTRFLAERKQTILRSIEAQGKLSEKLAKQIQSASTTKRLEDLYLSYKPKKQTLATLARTRGLEDLAREILEADPAALNLDVRAADFVNSDKKVASIADALLGAGHILAEQISERAELRQRLREILQRNGKLVCARIEPDARVRTEKAASQADLGVAPGSPLASTDGQATITISRPLGQALAQPEPIDPQNAAGLAAGEQWVVAEPAAEIPAARAELALPELIEPQWAGQTGSIEAEPIIPQDQEAVAPLPVEPAPWDRRRRGCRSSRR